MLSRIESLNFEPVTYLSERLSLVFCAAAAHNNRYVKSWKPMREDAVGQAFSMRPSQPRDVLASCSKTRLLFPLCFFLLCYCNSYVTIGLGGFDCVE